MLKDTKTESDEEPFAGHPGIHPVTGRKKLASMPYIIAIGSRNDGYDTVVKGLSPQQEKPGEISQQTFERNTAVVSPANSFGWMDGGIDAGYLQMFGQQIEARVQKRMRDLYPDAFDEGRHGMPLGKAFIIRTYPPDCSVPNGKPEWLIVTPTMIKPGRMLNTGAAARPKATPDVAGKALQSSLEQAVLGGIEYIAVPAMGMGTAAGIEKNAFIRAFGDAYDNADMAMFTDV